MKLSQEELRARLDELVDQRHPSSPDRARIERRAGRLRRRRQLAGAAVGCIALVGAATIAFATMTDAPDDQPVRTSDDVPAMTVAPPHGPEPEPITNEVTRTLPDGQAVRLVFDPPKVVFGPFGIESRWTQPAACPRQLRITRTIPDGMTTGSTTADPGATETAISKVLMPWNGGDATGAGAEVPDLAIVVIRPVAGATYQLVAPDGAVVDESPSDGTMLVLFGASNVPAGDGADVDAVLHGAEGGAPTYRVRAVEPDGAVLSEGPTPTDIGPGFVDTPRVCAVPDRPTGIDLEGAPADIAAATRAVEAVVSSLATGNQGLDALVAATDGAADLLPLAHERGFAWVEGTSIETTELVWTSPRSAWVHAQLSTQQPGTTNPVPMGEQWIRLIEGDAGWRLDRPSACALLAAAPGSLLGSSSGEC